MNGRDEVCSVWEGVSGWGAAGEVSGGMGVLVLCADFAASAAECAVLVLRKCDRVESVGSCFGGCGE